MVKELIWATSAAVTVCLGADTAFGQESRTADLGVSHSWLSAGETMPAGVVISGGWRLLDRLQLVGEAGWHAERERLSGGRLDRDVRTLLVGARVHVWSAGAALVFTDVQVGWHRRHVHFRADTVEPFFPRVDIAATAHAAAIQVGGGATVWQSGRLGADVLAHYRRPLRRSSGGELRIGGGLRVAF
jgi:hypothetical protein